MNIGEKIKRLRGEKFMTQAELAGDKITRNMLSLIEKGTASPSVQTLVYLAERLKVSPGYLLADSEEEGLFLKSEKLSEIRLAYARGDHAICLDLCKRLQRSDGKDDELLMIMAECALELGKEELLFDRVKRACSRFDEAIGYASETVYHTEPLEAMAWMYFEYLGGISPSISSENQEYGVYDMMSASALSYSDPFCRYLAALAIADGGGAVESYLARAYDSEPLLAKHVSARMHMFGGEYELAGGELGELLRSDERLPGMVLYHVFEDLETCCRQLDNAKNARLYAEARVEQFERLMS